MNETVPDSATPPVVAKIAWQRRVVFLLIGGVVGTIYWRHADWWAYVDAEGGRWPKFTMPLWWQVGESALVGIAASAVFALGWWSLRRIARCVRSRIG